MSNYDQTFNPGSFNAVEDEMAKLYFNFFAKIFFSKHQKEFHKKKKEHGSTVELKD